MRAKAVVYHTRLSKYRQSHLKPGNIDTHMAQLASIVESVRLSDDELTKLYEELDGQEVQGMSEARRHQRMNFRSRRVVIHVLDNHDSIEASFRVVSRNISAGGLGIIHGQMLTVGKRLLVQLPRDSDRLNLVGQVAHCRHIKGMLHEVGIQFLGRGDAIDTASQLAAAG